MRIVLFGPAEPFRGGVPLFTGALCRELQKAGHDVKIVGFAKLFPKWLYPGKSQTDESASKPRTESERIFVAWSPRTWKQTARAIESFKPDLILAMWWIPAFGPGYRGVARALSDDYRKRVAYLIHDVVSHERRPGDVWLAKIALKTAQRFLVLSQAEKIRLRKLLPDVCERYIHYAPHPVVDTSRPFPGSAEDARRKLGVQTRHVLLFFGFVRRYKGLDLLLLAMPQIVKDNLDTSLLVCGPFHEKRARYEKLSDKLGIRQIVVFHDRYFSGDESSVCFAAADAVVLPYRTATQSGVIPIALSLATPVIATRAGGLEEAMKGKRIGVAIKGPDPLSIADAVHEFYAEGGRAAFEDDVRTAAQESEWSEIVRMIELLNPES